MKKRNLYLYAIIILIAASIATTANAHSGRHRYFLTIYEQHDCGAVTHKRTKIAFATFRKGVPHARIWHRGKPVFRSITSRVYGTCSFVNKNTKINYYYHDLCPYAIARNSMVYCSEYKNVYNEKAKVCNIHHRPHPTEEAHLTGAYSYKLNADVLEIVFHIYNVIPGYMCPKHAHYYTK